MVVTTRTSERSQRFRELLSTPGWPPPWFEPRVVVLWHQRSGPRWRGEFERVRSPRDWSLTRREWAVLAVGYPLLALANYREAVAIANVAGFGPVRIW
jgi:hypothetical protein